MVLSPSMSVSLASVNLCKLPNTSKTECSNISSCVYKVPRFLTGSLASTTQSSSSSDSWRRRSGVRHVSRTNNFLGDSKSEFYVSKRNFASRCGLSESCDVINPESLWEGLKPSISYLSQEELNLVYDALKLAFEAHDGQKRRSGEPFIIHPVEVARILGELELDWQSIAAGLLHDTVEDTDLVTFERIEKEFGSAVRNIVEGETKVSKLGKIKCDKGEMYSKQDVKADDLRQMFLSMTQEVRVIIVKLADRLHNMRTLAHMPPEKQKAIAGETLQVFAPLAKLLGMYQIKAELEYLSFMYSNPSHFTDLCKRVDEYYRSHEKELEEAKRILKEKIENDQYLKFATAETEVHSACKELYNVYKSKSELNQIAQLRIVIKTKNRDFSPQQVCYHILGLVHGIWKPVPQAVKDYIANAKPNGYQSLHTTVIPFLKESMFRLEVQIRTEEMDLIAERGIAAHYSGNPVVFQAQGHKISGGIKQGKEVQFNHTGMALRIGWLNAIREWQEEFLGNMSSREFVETVTRDLLGSRVFVFTPKGEIKNLPKGATVIDYAYLIHTEIGNKMVKAKVNGNDVSPIHELKNAEVVEIITTDELPGKTAYQMHQQWMQHAKTRSARYKILKFLKEQGTLLREELTADRVHQFGADLDAPPQKDETTKWEKIIKTESLSFKNQLDLVHTNHNKDLVHVNHSTVRKAVQKVNGSGSVKDTGLTEFIYGRSAYKEILPVLEAWKAGKIATWHNVEGGSVNWLCVLCVDRKRMMAEVTSALTANGIDICSCVVETDKRRGLSSMLFHFEGSNDNLEKACISIAAIQGFLHWSVGCSWMNKSDQNLFSNSKNI
ncbi:hypothetical protein LUZ60_013912 [Juncus effusus]|nr:hypothetical protein LUZ60_013912 [Juncus effusus]